MAFSLDLYSREWLLTIFTKHRDYSIKNNLCLQNKNDNHIEICPLLLLKAKHNKKGKKNPTFCSFYTM